MKSHPETAAFWPIRTALAAGLALWATGAAQAVPQSIIQTHNGSLVNQLTIDLLPSFGTGVLSDRDQQTVLDTDADDIFRAASFDTSLGELQRVEIVYTGRHGTFDRLELDYRCEDSGLRDPSCDSGVAIGDLEILYGVIDPVSTFGASRFARATLNSNTETSQSVGLPGASPGVVVISRGLFRARNYTTSSDLAAFQTGNPVVITPFFRPTLAASVSCDPSALTVITACASTAFARYSANYGITLTYHYDDGVAPPPAPVPLPAGAPLLLAALGGLAWIRRRRG